MRNLFFCYERSHVDGRWQPVVYYDDVPALNSAGKESAPLRSTVWPVPAECRDGDEPRFKPLTRKFRKPAE